MNVRFVASMAIAIISLAVGFYLLNDINQENAAEITQKHLDKQLTESNERLAIIKDKFYNGEYHGELQTEEVINIIKAEVATQKKILEQYNELPSELKTDKTIDMRFWQLGKYSWAGEESMLNSLEKNQ